VGSSDRDLLNQARDGDEQALTGLLQEHGPGIRHWVEERIPQRWQSVLSAHDVMQQTYTDAFLDLHRFEPDGESSFPAWLTSLARCNLADALRMLAARKRGDSRQPIVLGAHEDSFVALYELLAVTRSTPSRHAARDEARVTLAQAIGQLPEDYRVVVQMYDLEGKPVEEVATALNRSTGAVYMIRARAHRRLGALLGNASKYFSKA